jgi:hypothetical protein
VIFRRADYGPTRIGERLPFWHHGRTQIAPTMMLLLTFFAIALCGAGTLVTAHSLRNAPVASEDDNGFHADIRD